MGKRGDELDGRADLYSLGVVMYQMLTADLPFKADTTMEMLLAHMQKAAYAHSRCASGIASAEGCGGTHHAPAGKEPRLASGHRPRADPGDRKAGKGVGGSVDDAVCAAGRTHSHHAAAGSNGRRAVRRLAPRKSHRSGQGPTASPARGRQSRRPAPWPSPGLADPPDSGAAGAARWPRGPNTPSLPNPAGDFGWASSSCWWGSERGDCGLPRARHPGR